MTRTPLQASENSIKGERVHVEIGMNPKSVVPAVMEAGGGGQHVARARRETSRCGRAAECREAPERK